MTSWTQELIEHEARLVAHTIGHFPSNTELREMGRNDLACAITKRGGGLLALARKLGMERAQSDSDFGWAGEDAVVGELRSRGFSADRTNGVRAPFDILVNGVVRVDVKNARFASYPTKTGSCDGWFYRLGKMCQADVVVLRQHDEGTSYVIPWRLVPTTNITITRDGKYSRYKEAWWIIERLCAVMSEFNDMAATGAVAEPVEHHA